MLPIGRRVIGVVTDAAAPGLMLYGLHRQLASDTDDTDYEPGKKVNNTNRGKRKKLGSKTVVTSSEDSSSDSDSSNGTRNNKGKQKKRRLKVKESSDESTAISSREEEEEDAASVSPLRRKTSSKRKRKYRAFGCDPSDDSEDSDFDPDGIRKPAKKPEEPKRAKRKKKGKISKRKTTMSIKERSRDMKRDSVKVAEQRLKNGYQSSDESSNGDKANALEDNCGNSQHAVPDITTEKTCKKNLLSKNSLSTESLWATLPVEILSHIFHLVASSDSKGVRYVCRCAQVCRDWNNTASKPVSWKVVDLAFMAPNMKVKKADKVLKRVAKNLLAETKDLVLSGWTGLTDKGLCEVANRCPRLESLNISNCQKGTISKLTADSLLALAENCPLERINFSSVRISMNYVKTIMQFVDICGDKLTHVNVSGNIPFNTAVFNTVCQSCPKLKIIDVSNTSVRAISFKDFQQRCSLLQELYFTNLSLEPKDKIDELESYPGFKHLRICSFATFSAGSWLSGDLLYCVLKSAEELSVLDVRGWRYVTLDDRIPTTRLERLFFSQCGLDVQTISFIGSKWSETLWELDLSKTHAHGEDFNVLIEPLYEGPHACVNLHHLNISGTAVNEIVVKGILGCCSELESIDLTSCRAMKRGVKREHRGSMILKRLHEVLT